MDAINVAKPGSVISNINYFGFGHRRRDIIPLPRVGWKLRHGQTRTS